MRDDIDGWLLWRYRAEYFAFRVVACLLQMLSPRQSAAMAQTMAFIVFRMLPRKLTRYRVARENLRTAFGDRLTDRQADRLIHGMWVHLFRMIAEILQLRRKLHVSNIPQVLSFRDRLGPLRSLCSDRPVILLSGHYGNWEMSVAVFGMFGFPMAVVARPLDNPYLDRWFEQFRRHTGHSMIAKKGAFNRMAAVLERGGSLALLADQDAGSRGTFVDFFGRPASTFPTIARLAMAYNAYIVVGYSRRLRDDFQTRTWSNFELGAEEVVDPLDFEHLPEEQRLHAITQQFTSALEKAVRLAPEQYFWVHRRWKTTPGEEVASGERGAGSAECGTRDAEQTVPPSPFRALRSKSA